MSKSRPRLASPPQLSEAGEPIVDGLSARRKQSTLTVCRRSVVVAATWWSPFNSTGWALYGQMKKHS